MRLVSDLVSLCLVAALSLAASAAAQNPTSRQPAFQPPRTPEGRADFQGVWTTRWLTPLERLPGYPTLALAPAEAPGLMAAMLARLAAGDPLQSPDIDPMEVLSVNGELRASLIVDPPDGLLPYTAEGKARRAAFLPNARRGADDPEQRGLNERCIGISSAFAPYLTAPISNIRQIVQTKDHIAIYTEHYIITRIIPFADRKAAPGGRHGEVRARWEGDTLAIASTGFRPDDDARFTPFAVLMISPQTQITERFTQTGAGEMLYRFTVEDPLLYTQAWTAETVMRRSLDRMYEYACHEGNYGLPNILSGGRAMERRAKGGR